VRFLGPSPKEDKRNRGRENRLCVLPTHRERKRRVRKRKKSLCLPGGEEEREWEGRSIEAESRGVELSSFGGWPYEPTTIAGWPAWIKDSWTRGVHVKTASHFFRKKKTASRESVDDVFF